MASSSIISSKPYPVYRTYITLAGCPRRRQSAGKVRVSHNHTRKNHNGKRFLSTLQAQATHGNIERADPGGLSALPTRMLLRSVFVATISSNRFLLIPSLKLLSFLSKPGRSSLLSVDQNPLIHAILKKTFYEQFCAGETVQEAKKTCKEIKDMGFRGLILTLAKETVFDERTKTEHGVGEVALEAEEKNLPLEPKVEKNANIETWLQSNLETIDFLGETDYLALKLTGAGPTVTKAFADRTPLPQQMTDALDEIASRCEKRNVRILVDAESQHYQFGIMDAVIDLMRKFNKKGHALIYNTYQAYLKSTPATLQRHFTLANQENFTVGLKLVRGAYINSDKRTLIHDTKQDTDNAYNSIAQGAIRQQYGSFGSEGKPFPSLNLFLAGHNKTSVYGAHELHQYRLRNNLPTVPVGYAQLHGMSDDLSFGLLRLKDANGAPPEVYKCSQWGTMGECVAYLLRRAIENRDAVSRTGDELQALRKETWRRMRAIFSASKAKA